MSFESEVIPMFIVGVCIVSLVELVVGCAILKTEKEARSLFIAHVISMAVAMVFLVRCIFAGRLGIDVTSAYGDASPFNSVNIGLFGVFWSISVGLLLATLGCKMKK